ncbi:MAG: hypothetical protein IKO47_05190 [Ruminococcus sp.]|nr:hypothetical protein [Ruminococcus sp.]
MNKNVLYRLYAAVFVGVCLVPSALMPVFRNSSNKEKRTLASFPKAKTEDGSLNFDYFSQFEDWFSDHMALRQQLVTADGRLRSALFCTSANSDVIVGSDGWLYYGKTVDDFLRINTLSERGVNNICHNIDLISRYCSDNGAEFIFTVAPNKNSVYSEHMPFNYVPSDNRSNYERLAEKLSGSTWFCDMKQKLVETTSSIPLYHKTDTHWNNLGAYVGHVSLMDMLGRESCPAGNGWYTRNDRLGDLAAMLYPAEEAKDTNVYNDYEYTYNYQGRFKALDDITIKTVCAGGEGELLMFRDSYGEAILPYMAECFASAEFSRAVPYRLTDVKGKTVIIEIVERNLGNLQKYAPLMNAPEADISGIKPTAGTREGVVIKAEKNGMLTHICGVLPDSYFSSDSAVIYVTVGGKTYEAFNCFDDGVFSEGSSDNGFSMYISSEEEISPDDITVTAVSSNGSAVRTE